MKRKRFAMACWAITLALLSNNVFAQSVKSAMGEQYRPQIHFSPEEHWMNDPNGMVYYAGTYHLFYQYYPGASVWGPMHWAHATSKDLVHWQRQPIALYPDSLGLIFSGSAVVDKNNTSGFGKNGVVPLVAIFTLHDTTKAKAITNTFQNQGLAYSLDNGKKWVKYANNPVLKSPGISDFRDPKVMWFEEGKKWVMTLATKDRVTFYSSPNLKDWTKESEVGQRFGAHGGVWECPDLFALNYNGKKVWVLTVSINPGGPNGGSATQYFTGQFTGHEFLPNDTLTRWIDYGPDDYAGVTWSNTGNRKIFLGWMNNWTYANMVPTTKWRGAGTLPRQLGLKQINGQFLVTSTPVKELDKLVTGTKTATGITASGYQYSGKLNGPFRLRLSGGKTKSFSIAFLNDAGEKAEVGYDEETNQYYIDRTNAGEINFFKKFAGKHTAPRVSHAASIHMEIYVDAASVELFADDGLSVITSIQFPSNPYNTIIVQPKAAQFIKSLTVSTLKSIWK